MDNKNLDPTRSQKRGAPTLKKKFGKRPLFLGGLKTRRGLFIYRQKLSHHKALYNPWETLKTGEIFPFPQKILPILNIY